MQYTTIRCDTCQHEEEKTTDPGDWIGLKRNKNKFDFCGQECLDKHLDLTGRQLELAGAR